MLCKLHRWGFAYKFSVNRDNNGMHRAIQQNENSGVYVADEYFYTIFSSFLAYGS